MIAGVMDVDTTQNRFAALARLVDVQLEHGDYLSAELAGAFLEATGVTLERYETVVSRVGRAMSGQLPPETVENLRAAVSRLQNARTTLGALASALDPHGYGRGLQ